MDCLKFNEFSHENEPKKVVTKIRIYVLKRKTQKTPCYHTSLIKIRRVIKLTIYDLTIKNFYLHLGLRGF